MGVDVANPVPFCQWLADNCRAFLGFTGLVNVGYYSNISDATLYFMKDGVEASSDYGPLGMLALFCALWVALTHPSKAARWKLAAAGFLSLGLICCTTGWQPWSNRFLLLPVVLFTLVFILGIVQSDETPLYRHAAKPLFLLLLFSAIVFPLFSYNRGPENILLSIRHRDVMVTKERSGMLEIMRDIRTLPDRGGPVLLLLHAGGGSWILPILQIPLKVHGLQVMPTPELTGQTFQAASEKAAGRPVYILVLNRQLDPDPARGLTLVRKYTEKDCSLLKLQAP